MKRPAREIEEAARSRSGRVARVHGHSGACRGERATRTRHRARATRSSRDGSPPGDPPPPPEPTVLPEEPEREPAGAARPGVRKPAATGPAAMDTREA